MPLRSSLFDLGSSRVLTFGDSRRNVQHPIGDDAEVDTNLRPELVKCPEFLLTGLELEKRTTLHILHKKGRRFESPWRPLFVGIYARTLFYFTDLGGWPRGVVPLVDAEVKAVDRIFRHGDAVSGGDDCGPCWKVTSSSGRVLLFRASSHDARMEWVDKLRQATGLYKRNSMDGKAALALVQRLSRSSSSVSSTSSVSASSTVMLQSPRHRRRKLTFEHDLEQSELLVDALHVIGKQREEMGELRRRLEELETMRDQLQHMEDEKRSVDIQNKTFRTKKSRSDGEKLFFEECWANAKKIDLDTMLDEVAIELCNGYRGSTISDTLSEDDTPSSEGEDDGAINVNVKACNQRKEKIAIASSQSFVNESNEMVSYDEDGKLIDVELGIIALEKSERDSTIKKSSLLKQKSKSVEKFSSSYQMTVLLPKSYELGNVSLTKTEIAAEFDFSLLINRDPESVLARENVENDFYAFNLKKSHSCDGSFDSAAGVGNGFLQQQTMELAEIARNLQSSFHTESKILMAPSKVSLNDPEGQPSFSDVTDFDENQISSNGSSESIFSITQDDLCYSEEDGESERLSEFEAADSQFLEASGFLDSIHQVMKDFIASSQSDMSCQPLLSAKTEVCHGIDTEAVKINDKFCALQTNASLTSDSFPRNRSLLSHARSAREFFNGDIDGSTEASLPQHSKAFLSLVIEDSMSVVASILQSTGREDKVLLLPPLLRAFGSRNRLGQLISWAIEIEVASVINVASLFRSDDYASRLVSTYSKAVGSKFIRAALLEPIRQIYKLKIADMELNPLKEESLQGEVQIATNAANLTRTCQNIIDSILKNTQFIPSSYFHICSHLNSKVISRFDGSKEGIEAEDATTLTRSVIGGFLFLRFVCPAITTPHLYGLTKHLPQPETRRILVLVTKVLFKAAIGVKFGDREPQFKVMNSFIEKNSPAIQQLFATLAVSPSQSIDDCFAFDSRKIYSNVSSSQLIEDLEIIRSVSEKNYDEIGTKLEECACPPDVAENFTTAVLYTTDLFQKSSLSKKLSANMKFLSGFGKKPRSKKLSE
ncbi:hypothetical protein CCR75_001557 [Bremia lactucae]|uniref:Ras GTPase-activating protein n=1 Tax=Bremia lactucae TaxID=4779 RepID=A0A976FE50_BRELC|nr:hypothetical protein CCR75_001557 [Bremia lactucae]